MAALPPDAELVGIDQQRFRGLLGRLVEGLGLFFLIAFLLIASRGPEG